MAWHDPSEASAYCTGFAATSVPPSAGGSSTLKECAPVRMSTSVTPTSVPSAVNRACAFAESSATALRVSAMSELSDTADLPGGAEPASRQGRAWSFSIMSLGFVKKEAFRPLRPRPLPGSPPYGQVPREVADHLAGVVLDTGDERGPAPPQDGQPQGVQSRAGDHAALVVQLALGVDHRHVEPPVVGPEPGRPHDRGDLATCQVKLQSRRLRHA